VIDPVDPQGNETRAIHELVEFGTKDVLEIGCGDGRTTWRYADLTSSVIALDPFDTDIQRARANTPDRLRSTVQFRCQDAVTAEFEAAVFDVVLFSRSI
jgi:protein-L-isoaspartate O-methyltransferase